MGHEARQEVRRRRENRAAARHSQVVDHQARRWLCCPRLAGHRLGKMVNYGFYNNILKIIIITIIYIYNLIVCGLDETLVGELQRSKEFFKFGGLRQCFFPEKQSQTFRIKILKDVNDNLISIGLFVHHKNLNTLLLFSLPLSVITNCLPPLARIQDRGLFAAISQCKFTKAWTRKAGDGEFWISDNL